MIKLTDIARLARTSTSTVSKVLNDYDGVSEATRQRVLEAVKTLGYVPNASARQLITKRSYLVGLLFTESLDVGLEHPFYAGVIEAFRKMMNEQGYDVIFISPQLKNAKMTYLDYCRYRNLDGVFVCTFAGDDTELRHLFDSGIPCVTTDAEYRGIPLIISDNINAAKEAYNYLYRIGHRDILHIHGPLYTLAARERLQGFRDALYEHHLPAHPDTVIPASNFDFESGRQAARELLTRSRGSLPDAIIAASDIVALGIINELFRHGIRVPGDVSVIGFDNIAVSEYAHPALTTMGQDRQTIGRLTAQALIATIEGKRLHSRTMIPMELIERSSCRNKL